MAFRRPLMKNSHTRDAMTAFRRCLMKNSHTLMFASVAQLISPSGLQRVKVAAAGRRCNAGHTGYNLRPPEGSCVSLGVMAVYRGFINLLEAIHSRASP